MFALSTLNSLPSAMAATEGVKALPIALLIRALIGALGLLFTTMFTTEQWYMWSFHSFSTELN